jgi:hypothetical protein
LDNVNKLFNLIKPDEAIFSLLILKFIKIQEKNSNQILYFDKDCILKPTMVNPNNVIHGQPIPHFLERLKWQHVDGQHVV